MVALPATHKLLTLWIIVATVIAVAEIAIAIRPSSSKVQSALTFYRRLRGFPKQTSKAHWGRYLASLWLSFELVVGLSLIFLATHGLSSLVCFVWNILPSCSPSPIVRNTLTVCLLFAVALLIFLILQFLVEHGRF